MPKTATQHECAAWATSSDRQHHPCTNPGKIEHEGRWWCGVHNPRKQNAAHRALAESHAELLAALAWALPLALDANTSGMSDDVYTQWIVKNGQVQAALTKAREL